MESRPGARSAHLPDACPRCGHAPDRPLRLRIWAVQLALIVSFALGWLLRGRRL
jgi:hypothetical protein